MAKLKLILILLVVGIMEYCVVAADDCWTTGCQPNNWAVVGCAQYSRREDGKESCSTNGNSGYKYKCCVTQSGTSGSGSSSNGGNTGNNGGSSSSSGSGSSTSNNGLNINYDQFKQAVTGSGYPKPSHEQFDNFIKYAKSDGKIETVQELAMALAHIIHESDGLKAKREYACVISKCPQQYKTANCDVAGNYYFGRGYIQLTWCYNYRDASKVLFGDDRLVRNPEEVAKDDALAWRTAFWFWGSRVHGKPGISDGKFGAATKIINSIECGGSGHKGPAKRNRFYANVREAFGLSGPGDTSGC